MKILKQKNPADDTHPKAQCPSCGMAQMSWRENEGHGFWSGAEVYCCRGCAEATGCTCHETES